MQTHARSAARECTSTRLRRNVYVLMRTVALSAIQLSELGGPDHIARSWSAVKGFGTLSAMGSERNLRRGLPDVRRIWWRSDLEGLPLWALAGTGQELILQF